MKSSSAEGEISVSVQILNKLLSLVILGILLTFLRERRKSRDILSSCHMRLGSVRYSEVAKQWRL